MRVLFLTIGHFADINQSGIYTDLLRCFKQNGHQVYVVTQLERWRRQDTCCDMSEGIKLLRVKTGNITKSHLLEKGISTMLIPSQYWRAINKFWGDEAFDLILYSTPPITLEKVVSRLKRMHNAYTYLILKDIFPQNAVDLGILKKTGLKGAAYRYFRRKEKKFYDISDKIGCMSQANINYIKKNNCELDTKKLELCPNTIDNHLMPVIDRNTIRDRYGIPKEKIVLLYGGNFGKPQNVDFIVSVLAQAHQMEELHFIMCGSGTDFYKIEEFQKINRPVNLTVFNSLPFEEYSQLLVIADVGMIFLDCRFTIPNFPSRLLDYMNYALPVIAATDEATDLGEIILQAQFGWWCRSDQLEDYLKLLKEIIEKRDELTAIGRKAKTYLIENYTTEHAYRAIINAYNGERCKTHV